MKFRFTLEEGPGKTKITCPSCGHDGVFTRFIDTTTGEYCNEIYGMCDRAYNCNHVNRPPNNYVIDEESKTGNRSEKSIYDSDFIKENWHPKNDGRKNNLAKALIKKFGENQVVSVLNSYQIFDIGLDETVYPFTLNGNLITGKIIKYSDNLKREPFVQWLHNFATLDKSGEVIESRNEDLYKNRVLPLFGWDLIAKNPDKIICVVEGEKTAIICSIEFPEFLWLDVGSLKWLQPYKFPEHHNRVWLFFPDLQPKEEGKNYFDYWQNQINYIKKDSGYKLRLSAIVDYTTPVTESHFFDEQGDIADILLSYHSWDWLSRNYDGRMFGKLENYKKIIKNKIYENVEHL